ncbi:hypothetical protein CAEBREN_18003 [Caenorhabditis brenneri]|uniref:Protein kinase domain-containing protein n=1 Tax=Caenorhabditis brenneri TaxID=135651 RepID=G0NCI1_CAEBE|nr:hypothetical protein CAEBREN_18003 [Caenorhabditis brenneri]
MGTPIAPVKVNMGDKIKDQFVVKKKLGEGACGQVFLVELLQGKGRAAMKVEPLMKNKEDEILKMEVYVLKKLQNSRHVCRLLGSGKTDTYTYLVMSLLGKEIGDVRRRLKDRKISAPSTLRIFIQLVKALQNCPKSFVEIASTLRKLTYKDTPPYTSFMEKLKSDLPKGVKMTDPFEWNLNKTPMDENNNGNKSDREDAERGGGADTVNEVDESVITEDRGDTTSSSKNAEDYAPEDTLDNI